MQKPTIWSTSLPGKLSTYTARATCILHLLMACKNNDEHRENSKLIHVIKKDRAPPPCLLHLFSRRCPLPLPTCRLHHCPACLSHILIATVPLPCQLPSLLTLSPPPGPPIFPSASALTRATGLTAADLPINCLGPWCMGGVTEQLITRAHGQKE